jgi:hypothetical protein
LSTVKKAPQRDALKPLELALLRDRGRVIADEVQRRGTQGREADRTATQASIAL